MEEKIREFLRRELQPLKESVSSIEYELISMNENINKIRKHVEQNASGPQTVTPFTSRASERASRAKQCRRSLITDETLTDTENRKENIDSARTGGNETEPSVTTMASAIVPRKNMLSSKPSDDLSKTGESKVPKGRKTLTNWYIVKRQNSAILFGKLMGTESFWKTTPVVERLSARHLRTQSNAVTILDGPIEAAASQMDGGCSAGLCAAFKNGFPLNWRSFFQDNSSTDGANQDVRKSLPEKNATNDQVTKPGVDTVQPTAVTQRILPQRGAAMASPNRAAPLASPNRSAPLASPNRAPATASSNRTASPASSNRFATTLNHVVSTASPNRATTVRERMSPRCSQQSPQPVALAVASPSRRNLLKENEINKMVTLSGKISDDGAAEVGHPQSKRKRGKVDSNVNTTDSDSGGYSTDSDSEISIGDKHLDKASKLRKRTNAKNNKQNSTASDDDFQKTQSKTRTVRSTRARNMKNNTKPKSKTAKEESKKKLAEKEAEQKLVRTLNWVTSRSPINLRHRDPVAPTKKRRSLKRPAPKESNPKVKKVGVRQSKRIKAAVNEPTTNKSDKTTKALVKAVSPLKSSKAYTGRGRPKAASKSGNIQKKGGECLADASPSKSNKKASPKSSKTVPRGVSKGVPELSSPKQSKKAPQGSNKENEEKVKEPTTTMQPPKITAKAGTLKRRKQIRECQEYFNQNDVEDDFFSNETNFQNQMRLNYLIDSDSDISSIRTPTCRSRRDSDSDSPRSLTPCRRYEDELVERATKPPTPERYRPEDEVTDSIKQVDVEKEIHRKLKEKRQVEKLPPKEKPQAPKVQWAPKPPPKLFNELFTGEESPDSDLYKDSDSDYEYYIVNSD